MATISMDDFLSCLRASKVIEEEHLQERLKEINSVNTKEIVAALIRDDDLTKWQAKYLMSGRSRLHIGNYRLLERIRRDEFGDRFFAVHEQLHRLVEIQVFPPSLNKDQERRDRFLEVSSLAAKIDHPNLTHVYDIDQEGGRFFLVVEHSKGDTLDTFDSNELSAIDIARIVEQVLTGLEVAHQKKVFHGDIKPENLLVTDEEQIKILNLAMASLLDHELQDASPIDDFRAIGKLGNRLLAQVDSSNEQATTELANILSAIENTDSVDLETQKTELARWSRENEDASKRTVISAAPVVQSGVPEPRKSIPAAAEIKNEALQRNHEDNLSEQPPLSHSFIQRNSIAILATTAVFCLAVLSGTAWIVMSPVNGAEKSRQIATKGALEGPATLSVAGVIDEKRTSASQLSPIKSDREHEFKTQSAKQINMTKALEEAKAQLESGHIGKGETPTPEAPAEKPVTELKPAPPNAAVPKETITETPVTPADPPPVAKAEITDSSLKQPETTEASPAKEPEVANEPPAKQPEIAKQPPVKKPEPKKTVLTEEQLAKPFQDMPRAADLGDIASTVPQQLGKVYIPDNILMACELISGREISKSKFIFELERPPEEDQTWFVNFRKRKSAPTEKIGAFSRVDDAFNFQWEPNAVENDSYNYIRNCVLKLTGANQASQFVNLRTAVAIEGLFIDAAQGSARIESEINWLPNPENLIIEVDLPSYQGVPKMYPYPPTRQIRKNQPVNLLFSETARNNFLYLEVSADYRKEFRVQVSLLFNQGNGKPVPVDANSLAEIVARLSSISEVATAESQQVDKAERPSEIKAEDFEKLKKNYKKAAEEALALKTAAVKFQEFIPNLYGKQIPLRVFFRLDNHEIVLAQSSEN